MAVTGAKQHQLRLSSSGKDDSMNWLFGGFGVSSSAAGMANYYAENCLRCGKKLEMQPNGLHEDEHDRGYCISCYCERVRSVTPNYSGMQNVYGTQTDPSKTAK